jgi:hypothetical protein
VQGRGPLFLRLKQMEHISDYFLPSSANIKNIWGFTSTPPVYPHGMLLRHIDIFHFSIDCMPDGLNSYKWQSLYRNICKIQAGMNASSKGFWWWYYS